MIRVLLIAALLLFTRTAIAQEGTGTDPVLTGHCGSGKIFSFCGDMLGWQNTIVQNYLAAMMLMTEQLTAVGAQHNQIMGGLVDAQRQSAAQRLQQSLQAEAHKDYHPSESLCQIGTFARNLADSEQRGQLSRLAMNAALFDDYTGASAASTASGYYQDFQSRFRQFREVYCDPQDRSGALANLCQHDLANADITAGEKVGGTDLARLNRDIDFTRLADNSLTLDLDFSDSDSSNDEQDAMALARNLYWPIALDPALAKQIPVKSDDYMKARSLFAAASVAHDSLASILAMKTRSAQTDPAQSSGPYLQALLQHFGIKADEAKTLLGERPSYYAQMEVLSRKMLESPDFYTNLYDKPANVRRQEVALDAIKLMQGRDRFESALRREMLTSLLVEEALSTHAARIEGSISNNQAR
ncbi:MAG: hypothetical protein L6Q57_01855 [Alphaproteobacteria bacterium]|nr:hypothetical protein [Alphaproteobacteria bacterium]